MVRKLEGLGFAVELRTAFEVTRQSLIEGFVQFDWMLRPDQSAA